MPSKKKKYNARFPAGRIKRIMQSDEEVGKVAQAVPIIISRTLELFVESLLTKTLKITNSRNAKTLSTSHMKQCIMSEQRFDFLRELVRNIPDISVAEEAASYNEEDNQSSPEEQYPDSDTPYDLSMPSTSLRAVRQQQQLTANGHNNNNSGGAQYDFHRSHLKRSISSNSSDSLSAKFTRFDSTSVPQHHHMSTVQPQHPRLKHQSYSMPTTTIDNNNCKKPNINSPPIQQLRLSTTQPTAIPAPIVSIDYCNKPVVKIDYSNIPIPDISSTAPASAPANMSNNKNNSTFDFSTEPVISIDLSNIVNASSSGGITTATSSLNSVATISIGTPPSPAVTSLTTINNNSNKIIATANADQQSRNSKVTISEPLTSTSSSSLTAKANALATAASSVAATTTTTTTPMKAAKLNYSSDSYLEMDEDYDDI